MASKAQLAALVKARAARKKKAPFKKRVKTGAKTSGQKKKQNALDVRNATTGRRKGARAPNVKFVVKITSIDMRHGYVTPTGNFDTEISKAAKRTEKGAEELARRIFVDYNKYLHSVEVISLKKLASGYAKNPVPASKALKQKEAAYLFEDFTGHKADHYTTHNIQPPDVGLKFGECTGIMYETTRDGKKELYCHEFKKSARPLLGASHDGKQLLLVGGNYQFTNRGIVDN